MLWPKKHSTEHNQNYLSKLKLWKEILIFNMKTKELKNLSVSQLEKELANFKKEKFNLRIQKMNSQITNSARITIVRRTIAKILTFINQKKKEKWVKEFYKEK